MAERRMFAKTIVLSDAFLDMPLSARCLYFTLGMEAMDKGVLNNARSIARFTGCGESALQELISRGYIKECEYNTYEIVHWYENNGIGETAKKRNNYKYRKWRSDVLERDGKCVECGCTENLVAHHIKEFALYPLLRFELDNGITLCDECHKRLHKEARECQRLNGSK